MREIHGLSQQELAKRTKLNQATISAIERGATKGLRLDTVVKLSAVFEVTLDYMTGIDQAPLVRSMAIAGLPCPECGAAPAGHSIPDCMIQMHARGRSFAYIAALYKFTVPELEMFLRGEYRMRRERSNRGKTAGQS